jgi:hypothetical protein
VEIAQTAYLNVYIEILKEGGEKSFLIFNILIIMAKYK